MKIKFLSMIAVAALLTACGPSEEDQKELDAMLENLSTEIKDATTTEEPVVTETPVDTAATVEATTEPAAH